MRTNTYVLGRPLNDGPVLSRRTFECQPERIDWPFDHPNLKGEILGSTGRRASLSTSKDPSLLCSKVCIWSIAALFLVIDSRSLYSSF
jgi:hypothetical protein